MRKINLSKLKEYIERKVVLSCKTKEDARLLCDAMYKLGRVWYAGESYKEYTHWEEYEEETVYIIYDDMYGYKGYRDRKYLATIDEIIDKSVEIEL